MKRLPVASILFALVLALATSACGDTVRPAAATVNGQQISQDELDAELEAIQSNTAYVQTVEQGGFQVLGDGEGTLSNAFVGRVLTRQIFLHLVHEEFERQDLEVSDADLEEAKPQVVESVGGQETFERFPEKYQRTLLRRNAEVAKLQEALAGDDAVTEEKVRAFYDENQEQFAQTCVSHILFSPTGPGGQIDQAQVPAQLEQLKATAAAARAEIAAGADFAAIAAARSADASNKDQGGDLECGGPGRFVPEFEMAMEALAVGEVSEPVATQFGVHLIKVTDRKPLSFEEAAPQIEQQLQAESQDRFSDFLEEAVAEAEISVNPRYGTFEKDGPAPAIVPPDAPTTTQPGDPRPDDGGQGIPLQP